MTARRTVLIIALAAVAAAGAAPAAQAKGIERVLACGADGCADVTQRLGIGPGTHAHVILGTGRRTSAPTGAGFARLDVGLGDGRGNVLDTIVLAYAPAANRIRSLDEHGDPAWFTVRPEQRTALQRAIAGLRLLGPDQVPPTRAPRPVPVARVAEVFVPAASAATARREKGGAGATVPLVVAGVLLALLALAAPRVRRRRAPRPSGAA